MQIAKPAVKTELVLSLLFDESKGVLAVSTSHAPPVNLRTTLAYGMTPDEARQLAAALTAWADAQP